MNQFKSNSRTSRPRQDPVSCQLCRSKKLKCDRQQPCSNCSARGVTCRFAVQHARHVPLNGTEEPPANENNEVLARLKRLEDTVSAMSGRPLPPISQSRHPSPTATSPKSGLEEERRTTSEWLEGFGTRGDSIFSGNCNGLALKVEPIHESLADPAVLRGRPAATLERVRLPAKAEAISLFSYYMQNVDYLHPVLYPPFVRNTIDTVYSHSDFQTYAKTAHIALLLSIFASTAYLWSPQQNEDLIFTSEKAAADASTVWIKAVLDVIEHSRRTTPGSIEDIQAAIITYYLVSNIEGYSAMARSLHCGALTIARDLSLHKTDFPQRKEQETDAQAISVENEIKRRIWWHIVSSDWLLAFSGGPQEGTYLIQPKHMWVNYPRNEPSEDIGAQKDQDKNLASEACTISYFLQRIRFSEVCRTIVDSMPQIVSDISTIDYEHIITLDGHFEELLKSLPVFFRMDEESRRKSQDIVHRFPQIATQRYLLHLGLHTRRSKLHQPFLVRGFLEPEYASSRDVCLLSARTVLELNRMLEEEKGGLTSTPAKFGIVVRHVFIATVILVMDFCFNKIEGCEEQRRTEVMRAFKMLEDFKQDSAMAKKYLNPLMDILRKHNVRLLDHQATSDSTSSIARQPSALANAVSDASDNPVQQSLQTPAITKANRHTDSNDVTGWTTTTDQQEPMLRTYDDPGFDEMMKNYIDLGQTVDVPVWDDLFADLDSYHALDVGGNDFFCS